MIESRVIGWLVDCRTPAWRRGRHAVYGSQTFH